MVAVLAALLIPAAANASSYALKKGKCRSGFVRQLRHHKPWCVTTTRTEIGVLPNAEGGYAVEALVIHGSKTIPGLTVAFTMVDETTGQPFASFTGADLAFCGLHSTTQGSTRNIVGEAIAPYPACALSTPVSVPAAHSAAIVARFAGTTSYGPSVSSSKPF
jgi:hypothetical protein